MILISLACTAGFLTQMSYALKYTTTRADSANNWNRSSLIYHSENRNVDNWKRHLVRIEENGAYTNKYLFNHAILTSEEFMHEVRNGDEMAKTLKDLSQDARDMDAAMRTLPQRNAKFPISIGCPYVNNSTPRITLDGINYDTRKVDERLGVLKWYIKEINKFRQSNNLQYSEILGVYYHQEDVVEGNGDIPLVIGINRYAHELGMKTVWIPYYNAPGGFDGRGKLEFDVEIVQPSYSFASAIDGNVAKGDRLYAVGYKSAQLEQGYELEIRSIGRSHVEYWIAHQYFAIAQETGTWNYPQAFFVGLVPDMFDQIVNRRTAEGFEYGTAWMTYTDMANYLEGKKIDNWEAVIPISNINKRALQPLDTWETTWTVPKFYSGLSSVRLDFKDKCGNYWTGSVVVYISRPDGTTASSFKHRAGPDAIIPSSNSVFVPLADKNITEGSFLRISIQKYRQASWPTVLRLVAAKYEPTFIANPIFEEISSSSQSRSPGPSHQDTVPNHRGYERGKLTDGQLGPKDDWYWAGMVGWKKPGQFSVSIDLGSVLNITKIQIWTHQDQRYGVNAPINFVGLASSYCVPYVTGTLELSCMADAITAKQTITVPNDPSSRLINLPFLDPVASRYVTISGVSQYWALLDEIQVFDQNNAVISNGRQYKLNPMPGEGNNGPLYGDNARTLVDGVVLSEFIDNGYAFDGIHYPNDNDYVQSLWTIPKAAQYAIVWITESNNNYAIGTPSYINIKWRNETNTWSGDVVLRPMTKEQCGPSPCAKLRLPPYARVTGIMAFFPPGSEWYMITEISIM